MAELPVVISENEVSRLLHYEELIPRLEEALVKYSRRDSSEVIQPVRSTLNLQKFNGNMCLMPTYMENNGTLCTKFVGVYNREKGCELPSVNATVVLLDPETGSMKAVMEGNVITCMRTAAVSAISAKVRVWGHRKQGMSRFQSSVSGPVTLCDSAEAAVTGADVIVTVTSSSEPVLFGQWVKPGAHVAAVGACDPKYRELDDVLMKEAVVYVDSREGAMVESGDIILSGVEVFAELGEIISGEKPALREKTTLFKSLGMGVEDAVSAKLVFEQWKSTTN
ncbi:ketimine reductase mu-crystallin isoform X2 [Syngnathus typhle]|uniref:ketimine reductase mu-crystallin isoform X2 n=1 Tax=Syngnathus typhle TaxID=161592 RepID=UPI002A6B720B|nr:ketimine reductase mu-crystallin isoform X2 [Syngnathus typhle]